MRVALIQFNAGPDKKVNLARARRFVKEALDKGASFVLLPEIFHWRGDTRNKDDLAKVAESIPGESTVIFSQLAKKYKAHILLGSIFERSLSRGKVYNTSVLLNAQGLPIAKYRKIHLFTARIGDKIIKEADCFVPGHKIVTSTVPNSYKNNKDGNFTVGLSICYDLRFADLYSAHGIKGAQILTVPSCFTKETGRAHWESLLRARAIENLSYVLAPNQVGLDARGVEAYGNSMIISPWGEIIARGSDDLEEIVYGDVLEDEIRRVRKILPGMTTDK